MLKIIKKIAREQPSIFEHIRTFGKGQIDGHYRVSHGYTSVRRGVCDSSTGYSSSGSSACHCIVISADRSFTRWYLTYTRESVRRRRSGQREGPRGGFVNLRRAFDGLDINSNETIAMGH